MIRIQDNCLVTGGASFIGSHLVEKLLHKGVNVRVADDLSSGKLSNLHNVLKDFEFLEGNLKDLNFSRKACHKMDYVFHLAADHGGRGYISSNPANCAFNMSLDNIVFQSAVESGVEHITFSSSACVYPTDIQETKIILKENMVDFTKKGGAFADEEYGWAKLMGELSLRAITKQFGISTSAGRISTAYGPRENESHAIIALIAKAFIRQNPFEIWGDGNQSRGFTYVDDICDGLIKITENVKDGSAINLGTKEFISMNEISSLIFNYFNWKPSKGIKYLSHKPTGVLHRALDGSLAKEKALWEPLTSIEEGLNKTINWYIKNHDIDNVKNNLEKKLMQR